MIRHHCLDFITNTVAVMMVTVQGHKARLQTTKFPPLGFAATGHSNTNVMESLNSLAKPPRGTLLVNIVNFHRQFI